MPTDSLVVATENVVHGTTLEGVGGGEGRSSLVAQHVHVTGEA
jgi:hypothetical protein